MSISAPVPLDVFHSHKPTLISELEDPLVQESIAVYCRDADIIDLEFHRELVLVTDHKHKAEKLFNAVYDRIEAQPAHVDQEQCVLRRFIGALRRTSSCENVAVKLEKSLSREDDKPGAECPEDSIPPKDPLNDTISKNHRREIAKHLSYLIKWANALNLTAAQISGITGDEKLDYEMKREKVLELWGKAYKATYRTLCRVALELKERPVAEIVCDLVKGDWSSVCVDVPESNISCPIESTGDVQTIPLQPVSRVGYGREERVSGLRQRRIDTPAILTDAISKLYDAQAQSCTDQSHIASLEKTCSTLRQDLQNTTEDMEELKEKLNGKEEELRRLLYQKSMMESSMKSQVDGMASQVEDLKASKEHANQELLEKIAKCEQEKQSLIDSLKDHETREESLMHQIHELNKKVDILVKEREGWFSYARLMRGKMNRAMCTLFAVDVCTIVCLVVFVAVVLVMVVATAYFGNLFDCPI